MHVAMSNGAGMKSCTWSGRYPLRFKYKARSIISARSHPGWLAMKYGTICCLGFPASADAARYWSANTPKLSIGGFFISPSTFGLVCSGATFSRPPVWCVASSVTYSGESWARSMRMPDDTNTFRMPSCSRTFLSNSTTGPWSVPSSLQIDG